MNDLISRQAAIEEIRTYIVKPNISDDESEIKGFNDGLELAISVLSVLPSVQPEQKTGTWERRYVSDYRFHLYCSVCGGWQTHGETKYCPYCGARMTEV